MERLTSKKIAKELKQNVEDTITTTQNISRDIYLRYAEFEDFMQSLELENLEELEHIVGYPRFVDGYDEQGKELNKIEFRTYKESFNEEFNKNKKLKQENQALKDRWQKLKDLLKDKISYFEKRVGFTEFVVAYDIVLDKMQELEKE